MASSGKLLATPFPAPLAAAPHYPHRAGRRGRLSPRGQRSRARRVPQLSSARVGAATLGAGSVSRQPMRPDAARPRQPQARSRPRNDSHRATALLPVPAKRPAGAAEPQSGQGVTPAKRDPRRARPLPAARVTCFRGGRERGSLAGFAETELQRPFARRQPGVLLPRQGASHTGRTSKRCSQLFPPCALRYKNEKYIFFRREN